MPRTPRIITKLLDKIVDKMLKGWDPMADQMGTDEGWPPNEYDDSWKDVRGPTKKDL